MEDADRGVLILTSDVGGGHRSVTLALAEALEPFHFGISIVDVIAQGLPSPLNRIGGLYGPLVNRAPLIWHALYPFGMPSIISPKANGARGFSLDASNRFSSRG